MGSSYERYETKFLMFAEWAIDIARLSTCKRLAVGTVVTDLEFTRVLAVGYNGQPVGKPNEACEDVAGNCGCVHSEANALIKRVTFEPAIMISTHSPCKHCDGLIRNARIVETFYWYDYRVKCDSYVKIHEHSKRLREIYDSIR